jgi:hypothetical protein
MAISSKYLKTSLQGVAAPNLPLGPDQYNKIWMDRYSDVLSKFFSKVANFINNDVNSDINTNTVSNLPPATTVPVGTRAFVTDSTTVTFGATVTGGGAVAAPVYNDGSNWRIG